jgi:hypothetical protein
MSNKHFIVTNEAPSLPAIYNQAVVVNGLVFCSGTIAIDPKDGKIIEGDIKAHTVCRTRTPASTLRFESDSSTAPSSGKPFSSTQSCEDLIRQCGETQCVPVKHGRLCSYE